MGWHVGAGGVHFQERMMDRLMKLGEISMSNLFIKIKSWKLISSIHMMYVVCTIYFFLRLENFLVRKGGNWKEIKNLFYKGWESKSYYRICNLKRGFYNHSANFDSHVVCSMYYIWYYLYMEKTLSHTVFLFR